MKYSREVGERVYTLHRVNERSVYDVATELGTIPPNVTKWCKRFERECPVRARELVAGVPAGTGSGFLDRLRREALGEDETIPGFEDSEDTAGKRAPSTPPDDDADDETGDDDDLRTLARRMLREAKRKMDTATDDQTAARFLDQWTKVSALIDRIEKREKAREGLIILSRADVEQATKEIETKMRAVAERDDHRRCVDCGRAFRMRQALADNGTPEDEE